MKTVQLIGTALMLSLGARSQIYTAKAGETSIAFHSEAPIENIDAVTRIATIVLRANTGDLQISMNMVSFKFKNSLMEEHFNENYVESTKFPKCTFKGKIIDPVDFTKSSTQFVTVKGQLELHGVTKDLSITGTLTTENDELRLEATFPIRVADYNIKVPTMYVKNIAEVVDINFKAKLEPYKKN